MPKDTSETIPNRNPSSPSIYSWPSDPIPWHVPVLQLVPAQGTGDVHNVQFPLLFARPQTTAGICKGLPPLKKSPIPQITRGQMFSPLDVGLVTPLSRRASIPRCCNAPKDLDPAARMDAENGSHEQWIGRKRTQATLPHQRGNVFKSPLPPNIT